MKIVPGPDFPTAGYIYGRDGIEQAYKTGRGSFQVRAKAAIEQRGKDRQDIVVTELPYQVNKKSLIQHIAELINNKKIEGIADIRDESDRDGMRFVIEIKRDEEPEIILNKLFKMTQMQESFGMILLAIVAGQPRELGLLQLLQLFIEHRMDVVRRRTQYDLRKAQRARAHFARLSHRARQYRRGDQDHSRIVQPRERPREFARVLREQIRARDGGRQGDDSSRREARRQKIRNHRGVAEAFRAEGLGLSYIQIDAILELQLHRLTQLSVDEILKELGQIRERIAELQSILASEKKLKGVIVSGTARSGEVVWRRAPHANRRSR